MTALVDTSVLIDYLRGHLGAKELLEREHGLAPLHASEMTRLEVLAGLRSTEESGTRALLSNLVWHPVDTDAAEEAGAEARLLTRDARRFPMFDGLRAPY